MNALKHGCRSTKVILGDESAEEYAALVNEWTDHYKPVSHPFRVLVEEVAEAQWILMRTKREQEDVEADMRQRLPVTKWGDAEHKQRQLFMRYRTAAENRFNKAVQACERFQKSATDTWLKMDARAERKRDRCEKRLRRELERQEKETKMMAPSQPQEQVVAAVKHTIAFRELLLKEFSGFDQSMNIRFAAKRVALDASGFGGDLQWEDKWEGKWPEKK